MFENISEALLEVNEEEVLQKAQEYGIDAASADEFRKPGTNYELIEEVMADYQESFVFYSSLGGLTSGIGGFASAVAFTGADLMSFTLQLYHLTQRFAILNGFDREDMLHREEMMEIYFKALGINITAQSALKAKLVRASMVAGSDKASGDLVLKLIMRVATVFGKSISTRKAGQLIPVVGGVIGLMVNRSIAETTANIIRESYKEAYKQTWLEGTAE